MIGHLLDRREARRLAHRSAAADLDIALLNAHHERTSTMPNPTHPPTPVANPARITIRGCRWPDGTPIPDYDGPARSTVAPRPVTALDDLADALTAAEIPFGDEPVGLVVQGHDAAGADVVVIADDVEANVIRLGTYPASSLGGIDPDDVDDAVAYWEGSVAAAAARIARVAR